MTDGRRIYGIETEFGLTAVADGARALGPDEAARAMFRPLTERYGASNVFLPNGSRLYLDVGSHPEYATAECDSLLDVLAHERAGEHIMAELAREATERLRADGSSADLVLIKNNVDSHGNSYGCHENYLVTRVRDYEALTTSLLPFLVSRQLICGAGRLVRTGPMAGRFVLSQRADHMLDDVSAATTRSRPMINTRDEPHGDPRTHRRMHVIVGDSNMSDVSTLLKVGSMELMLRLLQADPSAVDDLLLADPMAAIRAIALDPTGHGLADLRSGQSITAIDLQGECLARCEELAIDDPVLAQVLDTWRATVEALDAGEVEKLETTVDWAIKRALLRRWAAKHHLPATSPVLTELDLRYHIVTDGGLFRMLEARGGVARITTAAQVDDAVENPPLTTRAALRGRFVRAAREHDRRVEVDWTTFTVSDLDAASVKILDPFQTVDERVDALIERMGREPRNDLPWRFSDPFPL